MFEFLARFGMAILAGVIIFLARRLHTKANGKQAKAQKITATVIVFIGGIVLIGTFVGGWMASVSKASAIVAAAVFFVAAGGLVIDWWTDKVPDKFAFWAAAVLPLAIVFGFAQVHSVTVEIGHNADRVQSTLQRQGK
jgi:hypothetical protein